MQITKMQVIKFMFLPGISPRVKALALNLNWFAYLMALIFVATRILPANHPYAAPSQQGKFGISDILFEAGRHLKGGFRHIDHYIIFGCFVLGIILLIAQFAILLFIVASHTADAMPTMTSMFSTRQPTNDLALMMLDKVFEIPNMFGSKFNPRNDSEISLFGAGLHAIIAFYNKGMLMIAGLIVLYYLFAVILETMQTGTPFGQRFQKVYVPFRIVIAIFLLLPLGYGFSAGQLLVLKLADWGSAFATNGWIIFNQKAQTNPLGSGASQLVSIPKTGEIEDLIRYYSLVHSCRAIYKQQYNKDIKPYVVFSQSNTKVAKLADALDYSTAANYFGTKNIKVIFGELNDTHKFPGHVRPYCGTMDLPAPNRTVNGAKIIQETYWDFTQLLWHYEDLNTYGDRMAKRFSRKSNAATDNASTDGWTDADGKPDTGFYANTRVALQGIFAASMLDAKDQIRNDTDSNIKMTEDILNRGWGGAGIWFNKIAEYNGAIVSANNSMPVPSSYPEIMRKVMERKQGVDQTMNNLNQFAGSFAGGASLSSQLPPKDAQIAKFLNEIYVEMTAENTYGDGSEKRGQNVIANMFGAVFGTYGLQDLRGNQEIHPLAKMSALGRSIIDRAILYMGGTMVMGGLSGFTSLIDLKYGLSGEASFKQAFAGMAGSLISFATIGVTVGVVLYYVIPFLPFLYFFFAVGRWVKSIFEAVIGIPLWALAHIRIDGEGIPGQAAAQGYYLLLEILLRPILVIFGLMAAVATFSALAIALDTLFDLVVSNVTGYTPIDAQGKFTWNKVELRRGDIDQFFYTIMYAVILYMMAMSCFKLIDLIPNSVLRFIGTGVAEFNDQMNLEQDIVRYTGISAYSLSREVAELGRDVGELGGLGLAAPGKFALQNQPDPHPAPQQPQPKKPDPPPPPPKPPAEPPVQPTPTQTRPAQPPASQPAKKPAEAKPADKKPETGKADTKPTTEPPSTNGGPKK